MTIANRFYPNLYTTAPELVNNTMKSVMLNMYNIIKHNPTMLLEENQDNFTLDLNSNGIHSLQMSELLLNYSSY